MKTQEEFTRLYNEQLLNELKTLEVKRRKTLLGIIVFSLVNLAAAGIFAVILVLLFYTSNPCATCGLILFPILILVVWAVGYSHIKSGYVKDFKTQVISKIVKFIDEGLTYASGQSISRSDFVGSRIFLKNPDRFSGEDHVSGTLGKTRVEFSEVHAEDKTEYTDSKGRRHTRYSTIFRGIFFIADFNKNFSGGILVLPDTAQKLFGSLIGSALQSANIFRNKLIKLEDPEFEKTFVVYGDDQIESRYVLSTSLMQRILEFKRKTRRDIYLSFAENKVMVAVPYNRNLFEPRLFRSIMDYRQAEEYYQQIQLFAGIVEDLNLNTRIWSKQ